MMFEKISNFIKIVFLPETLPAPDRKPSHRPASFFTTILRSEVLPMDPVATPSKKSFLSELSAWEKLPESPAVKEHSKKGFMSDLLSFEKLPTGKA